MSSKNLISSEEGFALLAVLVLSAILITIAAQMHLSARNALSIAQRSTAQLRQMTELDSKAATNLSPAYRISDRNGPIGVIRTQRWRSTSDLEFGINSTLPATPYSIQRPNWEALSASPSEYCRQWEAIANPEPRDSAHHCASFRPPSTGTVFIPGALHLKDTLRLSPGPSGTIRLAASGSIFVDKGIEILHSPDAHVELISGVGIQSQYLKVVESPRLRLLLHASSASIVVEDVFGLELACDSEKNQGVDLLLEATEDGRWGSIEIKARKKNGCLIPRHEEVWPKTMVHGFITYTRDK